MIIIRLTTILKINTEIDQLVLINKAVHIEIGTLTRKGVIDKTTNEITLFVTLRESDNSIDTHFPQNALNIGEDFLDVDQCNNNFIQDMTDVNQQHSILITPSSKHIDSPKIPHHPTRAEIISQNAKSCRTTCKYKENMIDNNKNNDINIKNENNNIHNDDNNHNYHHHLYKISKHINTNY